MSIYVSICCLGFDSELEHTVRSCLSAAEHPEEVNIGIAITGNRYFAGHIKNVFQDYPNVRISDITYIEGMGVGAGRYFAAELYDGEDYFFQIDAHTQFNLNWDTYLISRHKEAQKYLNYEKIALTAYPSEYIHEDDGSLTVYDNCDYNLWEKDNFMDKDKNIPRWHHAPFSLLTKELQDFISISGFAPAPKISAAFLFGTKELAKITEKIKYAIFWEEEIIHTIELIKNGFCLVYPGTWSPIAHLYQSSMTNGKSFRDNLDNYITRRGLDTDHFMNKTKINIEEYIKNEKDAVEVFERYNNISLTNKIFNTAYDFPKYYVNLIK